MPTINDEIEGMVLAFAEGMGVDAVALGGEVDRIIARECIARIARHGAADQIQPSEAEAMLHTAWLEASRRHQADISSIAVFDLVEAMLNRVADATPSDH